MKIYVVAQNDILERKIASTASDAVLAWEDFYEKYQGQKVKLQLITGQSTITLAHRCDSVQGVMGWLPKEAAREVLFAKKARKVGRPRLVNKAKSVTKTFILAEEVASKIEIVAAENGLTFSKYVRKVLENHIEKGV